MTQASRLNLSFCLSSNVFKFQSVPPPDDERSTSPTKSSLAPLSHGKSRNSIRCRRLHFANQVSMNAGPGSKDVEKPIHLATLGNITADIRIHPMSMPIYPGIHQNLEEQVGFTLGGACNAVIMGSRLGIRTTPCDFVGQDLLGDFVKDGLEQNRVDISGLVLEKGRNTNTCIILHDSSPKRQHTFIAFNEIPVKSISVASEYEMDEAHQSIPKPIYDTLKQSRILLIDGYALQSASTPFLQACIRAAKDHNAQVWIDPQAPVGYLMRSSKEFMRWILNITNTVLLTVEEAFDLTAVETLNDIISVLRKSYSNIDTIVLKNGADGCYINDINSYVEKLEAFGLPLEQLKKKACQVLDHPLLHVKTRQLEKDELVDQVGAGDSFVAGFAAGLAMFGLNLEESALLGNACGTATCMNRGAGENVASGEQIVNMLKSMSPKAEKIADLITEHLQHSAE